MVPPICIIKVIMPSLHTRKHGRDLEGIIIGILDPPIGETRQGFGSLDNTHWRFVMKRIVPLVVFFLIASNFVFGQQKSFADGFLGKWTLPDKANSIEIIKEGDKYIIIEFVAIKHELFVSLDGNRAVFIESGKGPGFDLTMLERIGDRIDRYYLDQEKIRWKKSQYTYFRN